MSTVCNPHVEKWEQYRDTRRGTYQFRSQTRYAAVANKLFDLGLMHGQTVVDVGAGTCQFGCYLREQGWIGDYRPYDAVLTGVDLETWEAPTCAFIVCIEVLEHLYNPLRLLKSMCSAAREGIVVTTPNSEVIDVITCDPTHVSVVPASVLERQGFKVERLSWFGKQDDSLLAWRRK